MRDPQRALADIGAERARRRAVAAGKWSLSEFVRNAWGIFDPSPLRWNWYLECLCAHLEAVARGKIRRLVGNGPPRFGKSNVFAICWPAWVWVHAPAEKFIFLSYSDNLAKEHSISCRRLLESEWYRETFRPMWTLAEDRNTQNAFSNSAGGGRVARSIRSGVTGLGATKVCVDDPLDADEAMTSAAAREEALRVVRQAVGTRLNDRATGSAVILAHRVHVEDPSQWAIDSGWDRLCVPMEYDPEVARVAYEEVDGERRPIFADPRTEPGQLIDPERFPASAVAEMKLDLGPVKSAAQLGQRPLRGALSGRLFQRAWCRMVDAPPSRSEVEKTVRRWDLASTQGTGSILTANGEPDWTVGVKLSRLRNGDWCVEDVRDGQLRPRGVRELVKRTAEDDGVEVEVVIPKDPGQAGVDQADEYVEMLAGWAVRTPRETGDKVTRFGPASAQAEGKRITVVRAPWNERFFQVCEAFPDAAVHDDHADALGGAVTAIAQPMATADYWAQVEA